MQFLVKQIGNFGYSFVLIPHSTPFCNIGKLFKYLLYTSLTTFPVSFALTWSAYKNLQFRRYLLFISINKNQLILVSAQPESRALFAPYLVNKFKSLIVYPRRLKSSKIVNYREPTYINEKCRNCLIHCGAFVYLNFNTKD